MSFPTNKKPNIFDYFEYRTYLKEYYEYKKGLNSNFSYRYIAQKVGIDHSLIIKVFRGDRHISASVLSTFQSLINLNDTEYAYFCEMVALGKAKSETAIKKHYETLLSLIPARRKVAHASEYEYFQHWYYAAFRSLLEYFPFKDDYRALSKSLSPKVTVKQAREAISLLICLDLIAPDENGFFRPTDNHITTGEKWHSSAIKEFQMETIRLSAEALSRFTKSQTDISTITMSMNHDGMDEIRIILKECRQKIVGVINSYPPEEIDSLFQLNMQLFPLADTEKKK